jgi:hypothetical protein
MLSLIFENEYSDDEKGWSYWQLKWVARICCCVFAIPLVVSSVLGTIALPIYFIFSILMSKKDIKENIENRLDELMVVYNELSEFEWRNEDQVYDRVYDRMTRLAEMEQNKKIKVPDFPSVLGSLMIGSTQFCKMRQETQEEFCARNICDYQEDYEVELSEVDLAAVHKLFAQQFEIIISSSKGDIYKEYYLGRGFMFLKINTGNSRGKPNQKGLIFDGT